MAEEKIDQTVVAEEEQKVFDNWGSEKAEDEDEDPEKALLELQEQRDELRRLNQAGMLNDERLAFHESQLDQGVQYYEYASEKLKATGKRSNVITVRLNDETLQRLDDLVSVGVSQSRSQAASMLISEGINAKFELFNEVRKHNKEVSSSRQRLQQIFENGFRKFE